MGRDWWEKGGGGREGGGRDEGAGKEGKSYGVMSGVSRP